MTAFSAWMATTAVGQAAAPAREKVHDAVLAVVSYGIGGSLKVAAVPSALAVVAVLLLMPKGILHPDRRGRGRYPSPAALSYTVRPLAGHARRRLAERCPSWLKERDWKSRGRGYLPRGFESHPLRHLLSVPSQPFTTSAEPLHKSFEVLG